MLLIKLANQIPSILTGNVAAPGHSTVCLTRKWHPATPLDQHPAAREGHWTLKSCGLPSPSPLGTSASPTRRRFCNLWCAVRVAVQHGATGEDASHAPARRPTADTEEPQGIGVREGAGPQTECSN